MRRNPDLAWWFLVPSAAVTGWLLYLNALRPWSWPAFEPGTSTWILLKGGYYGVVGLLIGLTRITRSSARWLAAAATIVALGADGVRSHDPWRYSYVDRGIDQLGYVLSRLSPAVHEDSPLPPDATPALPPLTSVTAHTPVGEIRIESGHGALRTVHWDGTSRTLELLPPDSSARHYGFFSRRRGSDGMSVPGYDWKAHDGINRGTVWEAQRNFRSMEEAEAWLTEQRSEAIPYVWTSDGLVIGWSKGLHRKTLSVVIQQILIAGQKPTRFPGADDARVIVRKL